MIVGSAAPGEIVRTPAPAMLKLIVSLVPYVPGDWMVMSGSPRELPALIAVIASRNETEPLFGVRSSRLVVTVTVAKRRRGSRSSKGIREMSNDARGATRPR